MTKIAALVFVALSFAPVAASASESSKAAKTAATCPAGTFKVVTAKAAIVNEDGSIRVLERAICVKR